MGLRITPSPTFTASVPLSVPGGDPIPVRVTYRWFPREKFSAFLESAQDRRDEDILADIVTNIDGIEDDDGRAVPYSPAELTRLLQNYQPASIELYGAWIREHSQAKTKN